MGAVMFSFVFFLGQSNIALIVVILLSLILFLLKFMCALFLVSHELQKFVCALFLVSHEL